MKFKKYIKTVRQTPSSKLYLIFLILDLVILEDFQFREKFFLPVCFLSSENSVEIRKCIEKAEKVFKI